MLRVLVENAADEKRVITDVRPEQKRLFWTHPGQRDQNIGDILLGEVVGLIGDLQSARP